MNRALVGLLLLAGCSVGPDYRPPKVAVPQHWEIGASTNAPSSNWWRTLGDATLTSLIDRAVQTNHDVRIAESRLREARALRAGVAWDLAPTVTGVASLMDQRRSENAQTFTAPNQIFQTDLYDAHFDARWEIDIFGGKRRALQAASARFAGIEEEQRTVLVSVVAEVARNYIEVRGAQHRLAIAQKNVAAQQETLAVVQARFRAGLASELEVKQAEALLATSQARLPAIETLHRAGIHRLSVLVGQLPGALTTELSTPAGLPAVITAIPVGLPADLLRRRTDVRRAEHELVAATAGIGMEVAELFPKFALVGSGGFQSLSASDWFVPAARYWSAGPTVTWRLLDFGRIRAQIKAANARQEQALAAYERTVLLAFEDVENALVAYANEQVGQRALAEAATANRRAVELANDLYTQGLGEFLNVLEAERALFQAEDQLVDSQRRLTTNLIALYKALGGGWERKYEDWENSR
ncbi:MAG: Solvent efflux pump outer membrane protein SrpC [Verrucomicrobiae bacterium]|nr:Solvent efflux pump outer membrane protein SrpC [Verrucomicrobiae bacterium]